jgi:hypothetical protein
MKSNISVFRVLWLNILMFYGLLHPIKISAQLSAEVIFEKCNPAVVELGEGETRATGFFIRENLIVTCYHVVQGMPGMKGYLGQDSFEVKGWRALDSITDLAILEVDFQSKNLLNLQTELPKVGSPVYVIGSSLGRTNTFSNGIVSKVLDQREDVLQIQFTAPSSFGNSGGPLLNDQGNVVGVVSKGSWLFGQNLNVATATQEIDRLLESLSDAPIPIEDRTEAEVVQEDELLFASLNFKKYRFGKFEVELPVEWEIKDGKGVGGLIFTAMSFKEHPEDVYRENISLVEGTGVFNGNKEGLLVYLSLVKKNTPEFNLVEMAYEAEWPYLYYTGVSNGYVPFSAICYLFNQKPNNYMIELGFEQYLDLKRYGLVYQHILKSIERR